MRRITVAAAALSVLVAGLAIADSRALLDTHWFRWTDDGGEECVYFDRNENREFDPPREFCLFGHDDTRYAAAFVGPDGDYGAAIMAAYESCKVDGSLDCDIVVPRGVSLTQSTPLEIGDPTGQSIVDEVHSVTIRGRTAGNRPSSGDTTRLVASSSLRPAPFTGTCTVQQDVVQIDGVARDEIRCTGGNLRSAAGFRRGDYIVPTGFSNAANNIVQTSGEHPLMVWRAEEETLVVESTLSQDAGLATEGSASATIQRLAHQVRTSSRRVTIKNIVFDAGASRNADFAWIIWGDNAPWRECAGLDDPYPGCASEGAPTGSEISAASVTYNWGFDGSSANHQWGGVVFGSTHDQGQIDSSGLARWEVERTPICYWIDSTQAQPAPRLIDSNAAFCEKYFYYVSAGGPHLVGGAAGGTDDDCTNDTFGEAWMFYVEANNRDNIIIDNTALEVTCGDGIKINHSSGNTSQFVIRPGTDFIIAYDGGATPVKMIEADLTGHFEAVGVNIHSTSSVATAAPTVVIGNPSEATTPLHLYWNPVVSKAGSGLAPTWTIDDGVVNSAIPTVTHATDCTARTDGTKGQFCYELDGTAGNMLFVCEPTAGMCDTAGEWVDPI